MFRLMIFQRGPVVEHIEIALPRIRF
jgi:hypothetical protein